ncbi:hypothetical protein JQS43_08845 [Natronosporangium hydrolyticum]|uniref:Uncharacterized protein n=1 Tax=Natronosporangium hydrolyticum TaxID=2811111 RepID=A0A895YQH0_9ACTN|nr:hypothetical protein [Natronosporangium hydrolyticum]QSB16370.1 hypothetical protein JQS43_08845 [Natronosporangium hydrolyticum]
MTDPLQQLSSQFAGLWVRRESAYGQVFVGRDSLGVEVTIAVLSATAAADPTLRNAFAESVWQRSVGSESSRAIVYAADLHAPLPWAAVRVAGAEPGAEQLLDDLPGVAPTSPLGYPVLQQPGPDSAPPAPSSGAPSTPGFGAGPGFAPAPAFSSSSPTSGTTPTPTFSSPPTASGQQWPSPAPPSTGGRGGGALPWLLGLGGAAMVVVLVVVGSVIGLRLLDRDSGEQPREPVAGPTFAPTVTPDPDPAPTETSGGDELELRPVEQLDLFGPQNFGRADETYTMQLNGFPFAFRTPIDWDCFGGTFEPRPDDPAWSCRGDAGAGQRVDVLLLECERGCDSEERAELLDVWLDQPEAAVSPPGWPNIIYVEQDSNSRDNYDIDLSHFIADPAGGGSELEWMVGVYVESPHDTVDDVIKILNDIISQTA